MNGLAVMIMCVAGALGPGEILVETGELESLENAWILDARTEEAFLEGHIPGAVHLDPEILSETRDGVVGMLKPLNEIANVLAERAVDPGKHIVIYSAMDDGSDTKNATRLFWILEYLTYPKVSLLNGGYAKWTHEGRPVSTEPVDIDTPEGVQWELRTRPELLAKRERVITAIQSGNAVVTDNRSPEDYTGLNQNPNVEAAGHIPGAVNVPAGDLVDTEAAEDGAYLLFRTGDVLRDTFEEAGVSGERPIITYCNSGRDASVGYVGYRLGGFNRISLYDGSMAEWSRESPVVTLPEEP